VNIRILGCATTPKQWKVALSKKGDSITKVLISNKKTRLFVDHISELINFVFNSARH